MNRAPRESLETKVLQFKKAVEKFNKYRSPEANAEVIEIKGDKVLVKITGIFCVSCGVFDYFEDIAIEADAEILGYQGLEDGFLVEYKIKIS